MMRVSPCCVPFLVTFTAFRAQYTTSLLSFTTQVVQDRGRVSTPEFEAFKAQGWTAGDAIEVVANVAYNTLTNYTNHLAETEVDFPTAPALQAT